MPSKWRRGVDARFAGREKLEYPEMHRQFWSDLPELGVFDALNTIEAECDVTAGLLRPADGMSVLFEPPPTKNPLTWASYQVRSGDTGLELARRLEKQLTVTGQSEEWEDRVETIDDFVRAWCGSTRFHGIG